MIRHGVTGVALYILKRYDPTSIQNRKKNNQD